MGTSLESLNGFLPGISAMAALICLSAMFSCSETALFYLSHDELRLMRTGRPRQRLAAELLLDPDRLLTAVLFWNLVTNLTYFAVGVAITGRLIDRNLATEAGAFTLLSLAALILCGEVLPKSIAVVFRRKLAEWISWPLALAVGVLDPVIPTFRQITRTARRTFWPNLKAEPYLHADDLERAVEESQHTDEVIRLERQVLHNILDLSEIDVEEIMRPRGTYLTYSGEVHLEDFHGEVPAADYIVLVEPGTDNVENVISLATFSQIPERHLEDAAEPVVNVPWCANLAFTLQLLRDQFCSVASVVDEYGETIGIVTYEDIIDTALLPQPSRTRRVLQREPVLEIAPGKYHVEGLTSLRYLSRHLGFEYEPTPDSMITVAGMMQDELEHIPEVGDECLWQNHRFRVFEVSKRGRLRAVVVPENHASGKDDADS